MGTWTFGLVGLACLGMMALFCLPMAVGAVRSWRRRTSSAAPSPEAPPHAEPPAFSRHDRSTVDG